MTAIMRLLALCFLLAACTPLTQTALMPVTPPLPAFHPDQNRFTSFDGADLGLTVWGGDLADPDIVVVGIHGMNDYANAFHMAAPWWAERGVTTYAYDQRGFGRSPGRGIWPEEDLMRRDMATAVDVARARHPDAILAVVGISMGGSVAMTLFAEPDAPKIDRLILSGPGLRGWGAMPVPYRASLWAATHVRPGWKVVPPRRLVTIMPSDNIEMLQRSARDPLMQRENRIDQVHGVVTLMEHAHAAAPRLPANTFLLYGARDIVIPEDGIKRTARILPAHVKTAYYPNGYHMLMRDLSAETVWTDQLAFMRDPQADLPSSLQALPWVR